MRRSISRLASRMTLLVAILAAVAVPHSSPSQGTPDVVAARTLLATNLADAMMNPPKGEDTEFFLRTGGVPNVFFLIDSSGGMERLPPNGPAFYGGANPTMPPGIVLVNPLSPPGTTNTRTVGCGLDPVSAGNPAFAQNEEFLSIGQRKFYPPCGDAVDPTVVGTTYQGHPGLVASGKDYANESSVCPHYTSSNSQQTGDPGYDPDFYNPSPNATQVPNVLWVKDDVYHESVYDDGPNGPDDRNWHRASTTLGHNFGNGWTARTAPATAFPYQTSGGSYATIDTFCAEQGTTPLANGQIPSDVCKQCLQTRGWYYDGFILQRTQEGITNKQYPSIWYTGNYLNFFPPKFVTMRKIVKDVISVQSKIRMALAIFSANDYLLVNDFNPDCAHPDSNFDSNRGTYVNSVNNIAFSGAAPLASALFDVGRFYHSPNLPWFGASWEKTNNGPITWESPSNSNQYAICYSCQTSSVILLTGATPVSGDGTSLPGPSGNPSSLADAQSGKYAGDASTGLLPVAGSGGVSTTDCPQCAAFSGADDYKNNLSRVSWYMHNYDLRDNSEQTKDCLKNGGRQTLDLYTVGYSTRQLADADTILANAAGAGGGLFVAAENPSALKQGILNVIQEIDGRSTSFSVATVSTLQTATGNSVVVPRFDPSKSSFWAGHLYRYELYSEFVNECDPASTTNDPMCCSPNGRGDLDCDGQCVSVFLQDAGDPPGHLSPYFVQEGGDGIFYRNSPNTASCAQAPKCAAAGKSCGDISSALAKPWWDAGETLRKTSWKSRKVFTVVDSAEPHNRIDDKDATVELKTSDNVAANAILPYLGNSDNHVCEAVANKIETAGDPVTAAVVRTSEVDCAKSIIRWVLGADVFNEANRTATDSPSWPPPTQNGGPATLGDSTATPPIAPNLPDQEQLGDRPFKLGDVFHSSPVVVDPPLPRLGILCRLGLHNQCLQALWRTTDTDTDDLEYDRYTDFYNHRRKLVLVGSNDGLLHAFNGGAWHADAKDPYVKGIDTSGWPFYGYYDRGGPTEDNLWAEELWAFLPPDMISKLPLLLSGDHQFFVDGSAMVRDIWADGSQNGMSDTGRQDDLKQAPEFHTIAIVGERRGGTHYFALDISDATYLPSESGSFKWPKFRWMYPQPDSQESLTMGETYTDFLPTPPPIGPVRIEANDGSASDYGPKKMSTPTFNNGNEIIPFHEVWVAMLSGGFDQQYVRGRGVHMVDAWTGKERFEFSYDPNDNVRRNLRYPIPATVGMVMWGAQSRRENQLGYTNSGFFDTATFGDTGGQLWVLRFHEPGQLGSDGKAQNWFGARAFQMGDPSTNALSRSQPFFYITANTALPSSYIYRAYIGSGDRYNLLDLNGGVCAADNIRACAARGCTVDVNLASNYGSTPELGSMSGSQSEVGTGALTTNASFLAPPGIGVDRMETHAKITVSACPSPSTNNGPTGFTKDVKVTCMPDATGRWGCPTPSTAAYGDALDLSNSSNTPTTRNWYFSVRIFDDPPNPRVPFTDATTAKTYDDNRLWIKDGGQSLGYSQSGGVSGGFTIIPASAANPPVPPDPSQSAGWGIYYDHAPTAVADGTTYNVNALDERTSSVGALSSFLTWNTLQPSTGASAASGSCFVSKCTAQDRRVAYHYAADPITGGSVLVDASGNHIRAIVSNTLVPSQGDQPTVFINKQGEVLVAGTAVNPEKGASVIGADAASDAVSELGWIEVSEQTHACRHATSQPAANVCR